jgi:uncharacterized protein
LIISIILISGCTGKINFEISHDQQSDIVPLNQSPTIQDTPTKAVNYPQQTGFVTDNANIIDPEYEAKITQLAEKIEKETTVEIAVVTIESLEGESREMYALRLFEQAGIGKKDKDNGLLILVAKQEREYRFEVGYGLEGIITDSMKVNIGDGIIVPNFRNGEYGKGIYHSMLAIEGLLEGNQEVISKYSMKQGSNGNNIPRWLFLIYGIFIILFVKRTIKYQKAKKWNKKHGYKSSFFNTGGPGSLGRGGSSSGGGFGGFGGGSSGGGGFGGSF